MSKQLRHKSSDARSVAVYALQQLDKNNQLQAILDASFSKYKLNEKDLGLCTELVYGYTRYRLRIDCILDKLLSKRSALPKILQNTLGISVYSLLFLDRIPDYAAVSWAVQFTKDNLGLKLSKLCNAVLRSVQRLEQAPMQMDFYKNFYDFYSSPQWIYDLWHKSYGAENAHLLLTRSLQRPITCIRLNKTHLEYEKFHNFFIDYDGAEPIGFDGFVLTKTPAMIFDEAFSVHHDAGIFSMQASGSQLALHKCFEAVPKLANETWWDACTGQGGKSFILLEQDINVSLVSDVSAHRLAQLKFTAKRLRFSLPNVLLMSAIEPAINFFGGSILLDVPCSGLGTVARRPDIRLFRSKQDVQNMIALQGKILQESFKRIPIGAYVIYMTCTLNPAENELQIQSFLKSNTNAREIYSWQTPHEHPFLEGMFASVIQKI